MIHAIIKLGNPVLETPAMPVTEFGRNLAMLVEDMFDTMYAVEGIGLAAPQIGIGRRVAVVDASFNEDNSAKIVLVNPVIVRTEGGQTSPEGCLSIPGFHEKVTRPRTATLRAQDVHGNWFERTWNDLLVRAVLHETDHLDGKLFLSRISSLKRGLIKLRVKRLMDAGKW
jgi:peptide deformylase